MNPYLMPNPSVLSVSGGRTSGFMLHEVIKAHGGELPPWVVPVFANTGKECDETLDFVDQLSKQWNVRIRWVEYRYEPGLNTFVEVDYATASRKGEPFAMAIAARPFLPNPVTRFCTYELKVKTINRFARQTLGFEKYHDAVGLRADEPKRVKKLVKSDSVVVEQGLFGSRKVRLTRPEPGSTAICPLFSAGVTLETVTEFWKNSPFDLQIRSDQGNCDLCLAGETEVVTSEGIKPIRELAGTSPELLVPKIANGTLSEVGKFQTAPVRSFGIQRLWRIELVGHGRSSKEVFATADHRWFSSGRKGGGNMNKTVTTSELCAGDRLRNLFRCPIGENRGQASRIGAMRGFVFGDGTVKSGNRPGVLMIHAGKDEVFLSMFESCCGPSVEGVSTTGGKLWKFYGLPNYWKCDLPSLKESRHYLMGWLSGWFAADGCVDETGVCVLSSAGKQNLEFARSLCAILGIQCSPVRSQTRDVTPPGGSKRTHTIFGMKINRNHLTSDFFWLQHHKDRSDVAREKQERRFGWTVKSVSETDRIEEVFCATVDGVGAFGLADGVMTGNCFLKGAGKIINLMRERPESAAWWIEQEQKITTAGSGATFRSDRPSYAELLAIAQDRQDGPGWLWADEQNGSCGEIDTDCRCTD